VKGFGQHLKTNLRPGLSNMKNSVKKPYFTVTSLANLIYFGQQWNFLSDQPTIPQSICHLIFYSSFFKRVILEF
jgi:hypothetical protein